MLLLNRPDSRCQRATANEEKMPATGRARERFQKRVDSLLFDESTHESDNHVVRPPAEALACSVPLGRLRMKSLDIHTGAQRSRRLRCISRSIALSRVGGPAERNPCVRTGHHAAFEHADRERILLADVLKRRRHEPRRTLNEPRNLCRRNDVRLLPAVNQVPRLPQQRMQLPTVHSKMRMGSKTDVERDHRAGFIGDRLELDVPEIATKPRRRSRGHVPLAPTDTRHLVSQPPVLSHDVGVTDRQQTLQ